MFTVDDASAPIASDDVEEGARHARDEASKPNGGYEVKKDVHGRYF